MRHINFNDAQQALSFLVPQLLRIEAEVYELRYPNFDFEQFMFVNTEGDMWDAGVVFYSADVAGKAEWMSSHGFDMPYASTSREQHVRETHLAGIGYEWNRGELERAARTGRDLSSEKAAAASRVAQRFIYGVALLGDATKGWTGLFNNPDVPRVTAAQSFTSGTPEQVLAIINGALAAPEIATNDTFRVDTVVMPTSAVRDLASRLIPNTNTTLLAFIQANNTLSATGSGSFQLLQSQELETAGSGGTRRMVAYERSREVVQFRLPGPHEFLDPYRKSAMTYEVPGIMNLGGTDIRVPKGMRYTDGI